MDRSSTPKTRTRRNPDEPIDLRPVTPAPDELPVPFAVCPTSSTYPSARRPVGT